ncbi:MAG TPA: prepilin-type N-terminal cleavage/methylation domain-containing protein [Kiritimatiellia bacterium]|nr:prepilin-type N-terminal cleavage/methylation domain-containing protein [Kiritimatiellia bacterium]HSA18872.1 prepilin-type N-terminal cleavage/methylation domain-containing protein [Kiritimatiellia bacterium]
MSARTTRTGRAAFTLIEVLVAVAIMAVAFAIVWSTFTAAVNGWQRGTKLLDQLHRGDFVMEQLVLALRSAAFFSNRPDKYGFRLDESGGGEGSRDTMSWVTSGMAFLPPDSPLANGLHRLEFGLDTDDEGRPAVAIRAWPHLADEEESDVKGEPWFVSTEIKGFRCRTYNAEDEKWEHEWENTNSVPRLVELTLYLQPFEDYEEPQKIQRLVEIPIAPPLDEAAKSSGEAGGAAETPTPEAGGETPAGTEGETGGAGAPAQEGGK